MAELTTKYWEGESLRMTLYIDENTEYVAEMASTSSERFINSIDFNNSEGNNAVNPLGVASSNSISIVLFDINDDMSPASTTSPYAGKILTGLKMDLQITYDFGQTWEPYGVYYTTGFGGGYSDGLYTTVSIQAEDRINALGNMVVPELPVYANIEMGQLIDVLFEALGFKEGEYYVDPKLNTSILGGVLPGTKVRDFLNTACQRMFARVVIDRNGIIRIIPALELSSSYNQLTVGPDSLSTLKNNNASNINYSKVNVQYYIYDSEEDANVYVNRNISLSIGHNVIDNITFTDDLLCIRNVDIQYKSETGIGKVKNIKYAAYQNGMVLSCDVEDSSIYGVAINVEGVILNRLTNKVSVDMDTSSRLGLTEYTFDAKIRMTKDEALELAQELVEYIKTLRNTISISGTILTSKLSVGDKLIIEGTSTMYDGSYKIIKQNLSFSESYKNDMTLLRLNE